MDGVQIRERGGAAGKLFVIIFVICSLAPICAGEEEGSERGIFSNGSFLSEAVSSVSDKINKVASGEEAVIDVDARGIDTDTMEYNGASTGRPKGLSKRYGPKDVSADNTQQQSRHAGLE
jgi:hypothetical protein